MTAERRTAEVHWEWDDHKHLVYWTTWKAVKRYGGDFDELYSESLVLYEQAKRSYNPSLGSASNWICFQIFKGLQELKRNEARHKAITGQIEKLGSRDVPNRKRVHLFDKIWSEASEETRTVLQVILGLDLGKGRFKNKSLAKLLIRQTLKGIGYTNEQVDSCFREIEVALV